MKISIGIEIPEKTRQVINQQISFLVKEYPDFNWTSVSNYHVNIQHFGETDKIKEIEQRIKDLLFDRSSFYLHSRGLGLFMRDKIIIYLDFYRQKILEDIERTIRIDFSNSESAGKFIPYVVLAKYRIPSKQQYLLIKKKIEMTKIEVEVCVKELTLFENAVRENISLYNKVGHINLL